MKTLAKSFSAAVMLVGVIVKSLPVYAASEVVIIGTINEVVLESLDGSSEKQFFIESEEDRRMYSLNVDQLEKGGYQTGDRAKITIRLPTENHKTGALNDSPELNVQSIEILPPKMQEKLKK
ncbi:hypothetical protein [Marinibactrum halimedae]|uniref:Uncharacterized protein n=1 Tax=Marinibactrum halimedae TaxID=1444977 RepID=A0AA37WKD7_9GAMM|nr:hypothetical protein [Marinibactrum halimedae]MCD9457768.1 hypothetical protein [Marinibactrum halimedae]GLS24858.1 hypothetical protein GCM10007877_05720 [Marinibactrum halimedae]